MAFCKSRATPLVNKYSDTRLKRRLAVMRRSNTTGALSTAEIAIANGFVDEPLPMVSEFDQEAVKLNTEVILPPETMDVDHKPASNWP